MKIYLKIENNVIVFDTSKVTFGEKNIMNVENQLQVQDKAIVIFGKENKIDVKPLKQTVKMAAEGTSREGGGHSCKGRKKP